LVEVFGSWAITQHPEQYPTPIAEGLCRHFRRFQHFAHTGEVNPLLGQRLVGAYIEISLSSDEKTSI
jgi:hypothetical protein